MTEFSATSVSLGTPRPVDIAAIERGLVALWKEAGEPRDGVPPAAVRACALNLVTVVPAGRAADLAADLVGEVTEEHPARIFLVTETEGTGDLEAWISARCRLPAPGAALVCCEQVTISANPKRRSAVTSVVASLLVPDIPVVVLWKSPLRADDPLAVSLASLADRVLVDSSESGDAAGTLLALAALPAHTARRWAPGDLSWTQLHQWRAAAGEAFQEPAALAALPSLTSVTVRYAVAESPHSSGEGAALLLTAWLAGRLAWAPVRSAAQGEAGGHAFFFTAGAIEREAVLLPVPGVAQRPAGIVEVRFAAPELEVTLTIADRCMRIRSARPGHPASETVRGELRPTAEALLAGELESLTAGPSFEAALAMAARMVRP